MNYSSGTTTSGRNNTATSSRPPPGLTRLGGGSSNNSGSTSSSLSLLKPLTPGNKMVTSSVLHPAPPGLINRQGSPATTPTNKTPDGASKQMMTSSVLKPAPPGLINQAGVTTQSSSSPPPFTLQPLGTQGNKTKATSGTENITSTSTSMSPKNAGGQPSTPTAPGLRPGGSLSVASQPSQETKKEENVTSQRQNTRSDEAKVVVTSTSSNVTTSNLRFESLSQTKKNDAVKQQQQQPVSQPSSSSSSYRDMASVIKNKLSTTMMTNSNQTQKKKNVGSSSNPISSTATSSKSASKSSASSELVTNSKGKNNSGHGGGRRNQNNSSNKGGNKNQSHLTKNILASMPSQRPPPKTMAASTVMVSAAVSNKVEKDQQQQKLDRLVPLSSKSRLLSSSTAQNNVSAAASQQREQGGVGEYQVRDELATPKNNNEVDMSHQKQYSPVGPFKSPTVRDGAKDPPAMADRDDVPDGEVEVDQNNPTDVGTSASKADPPGTFGLAETLIHVADEDQTNECIDHPDDLEEIVQEGVPLENLSQIKKMSVRFSNSALDSYCGHLIDVGEIIEDDTTLANDPINRIRIEIAKLLVDGATATQEFDRIPHLVQAMRLKWVNPLTMSTRQIREGNYVYETFQEMADSDLPEITIDVLTDHLHYHPHFVGNNVDHVSLVPFAAGPTDAAAVGSSVPSQSLTHQGGATCMVCGAILGSIGSNQGLVPCMKCGALSFVS